MRLHLHTYFIITIIMILIIINIMHKFLNHAFAAIANFSWGG